MAGKGALGMFSASLWCTPRGGRPNAFQRAPFMDGKMGGFVAFDDVLRVVLRSVMDVTLDRGI